MGPSGDFSAMVFDIFAGLVIWYTSRTVIPPTATGVDVPPLLYSDGFLVYSSKKEIRLRSS